jgi:hypothetical protein
MTAPAIAHRVEYGRFVLGTLVGPAVWLALLVRPFLFPPEASVGGVSGPGGPNALAMFLGLLLPFLGFLIGGAIAGTALKRSIGAALGFGVAFCVADLWVMLSVVSTQAWTGSLVAGLIQLTLVHAIVFGIAGLIGLSSSGVRRRALVVGAGGFAAGGLASGILLTVLAIVGLFGGSLPGVVLAYPIPMTFPWIIGVALFGEALKREQGLHF